MTNLKRRFLSWQFFSEIACNRILRTTWYWQKRAASTRWNELSSYARLRQYFHVVRNHDSKAKNRVVILMKFLALNLRTTESKYIVGLLAGYVLCQLGALFTGNGIFFLVYIVLYLVAIFCSSIDTARAIMQGRRLLLSLQHLILHFLANLILFLIYLPTLIYNPEINWKLKGGVEQDPLILQSYVPPLFFFVTVLILLLTAFIAKSHFASKSKIII